MDIKNDVKTVVVDKLKSNVSYISPVNLFTAVKIFSDIDALQTKKELIILKSSIALSHFIGTGACFTESNEQNKYE